MKLEQRLYGCGCKKGTTAATPATNTTQTAVTVPTVRPSK